MQGQNKDIPEIVIGCAFKVHNSLGTGFLEKVYENALMIELQRAGLGVRQQVPVTVYFREPAAGAFLQTCS